MTYSSIKILMFIFTYVRLCLSVMVYLDSRLYISNKIWPLQTKNPSSTPGEDDVVCDYRSARFVYESAASEDKVLEIFPSMWHRLIGEPKENVELVYGFILSWLWDRANKAKSSTSCFWSPGVQCSILLLYWVSLGYDY